MYVCMCVCMYVCMYVECCVHVFLVDVNICNKYKQCEARLWVKLLCTEAYRPSTGYILYKSLF